MLSIFPTLLAFQQVAPLLLRLTLGIIFLYWAYKGYKTNKHKYVLLLKILEFIIGVLLIIGLYTQIAALISAVIFVVFSVERIKNKAFLTDGINYYFILLVISLSLLVLGPGIFAFDLPL